MAFLRLSFFLSDIVAATPFILGIWIKVSLCVLLCLCSLCRSKLLSGILLLFPKLESRCYLAWWRRSGSLSMSGRLRWSCFCASTRGFVAKLVFLVYFAVGDAGCLRFEVAVELVFIFAFLFKDPLCPFKQLADWSSACSFSSLAVTSRIRRPSIVFTFFCAGGGFLEFTVSRKLPARAPKGRCCPNVGTFKFDSSSFCLSHQ